MSKEIATTQKHDIRTLLASDAVRAKVAEVLPKYLTAENITRVMLATVARVPKLAQCSPDSLLNGLMLCAQAGLVPDGRFAHLIPYGDQVQVIFDYKGLVNLAERNGVQNIRAMTVHDNDEFDFIITDGKPVVTHRVNWRKPRGEMFAVYATCIRDGNMDVEVMQKEEVDAIRKRSRAGNSGPWVTDYNEMAKKTVLRRMSKRWPLAPEAAGAIDIEAESEVITVPTMSEPKFLDDAIKRRAKKVEPPKDAPPPAAQEPEPESQPSGAGEARPVEETVEPAPAEPAPPKAAESDPHKRLKALLKDAAISDDEFLSYLSRNNWGKFSNIHAVPASRVNVCIGDWQAIMEEITGA